MEGSEETVGTQQRVLGHVFGLAAAAKQPARQVIGGVQVRHHGCLEAAAVILIQHFRWSVRRQVSLFQALPAITGGASILFPSGRNLQIRKKSCRSRIKLRRDRSCMVNGPRKGTAKELKV